MAQFLVELLTISSSSTIIFFLIFYRVPVATLQQISAVVIVILLIGFNKLIFSSKQTLLLQAARTALIFLTSFLVQLIVVSTGGFYSPYLILFHLYVIGASLLISFRASLIFLIFALIILASNTLFSPSILTLYKQDPFSTYLYLLSFMTIIPLAQILSSRYHLKDKLSQILEAQVQSLNKEIEVHESIIEHVEELVIITDRSLNILSFNKAVENLFDSTIDQMKNKPLLESLDLRDDYGNKAQRDSLSVSQVLSDKTTHIVKGFYLYFPSQVTPINVIIKIQPIADLSGQLNQLSFVITDSHEMSQQPAEHQDLQKAQQRFQNLIESLKSYTSAADFSPILAGELISKTHQDIRILSEIEDHHFSSNPTIANITQICQQLVSQKRTLASALDVHLVFEPPADAASDLALQKLSQHNLATPAVSAISPYTAPLDAQWLEILLSEIVDICLFTAIQSSQKLVNISLQRVNQTILVEVHSSFDRVLLNSQQKDLFELDFGKLKEVIPTLEQSSSLEGVLVRIIATNLAIPVSCTFVGNPPHLVFKISLSRNPVIVGANKL